MPDRRTTTRALAALSLLLVAVGATVAARTAPAAGDRSEAAGGQTVGAAAAADPCSGRHWVTAWTSPPQDTSGPFHDQTLRTITTMTAAGAALRITLSNRFGTAALEVDDVHIARHAAGAAVVPSTVRQVTFSGTAAAVVPPGGEAVSDPLPFEVATGDDLAVSFHVVGPAGLDRHLQSLRTHYATAPGAGRHGGEVSGDAFTVETRSSFVVTAVDVEAAAAVGAVAVLGDSITEGIGSSNGADRRWTDVLARRLRGRSAVLNLGIGGNHVARAFALPDGDGVLHDFGPAAADRVAPDVLHRAGVTDLVVFAGINDVFTQLDDDVPAAVIEAYRRIVDEARRSGLRVLGATLTPASLPADKEADRLRINTFIRSSGLFDAVVDFDRAVADPTDATRLVPAFDADRVHLTDAGYERLGTVFPESLLQGTGCPA